MSQPSRTTRHRNCSWKVRPCRTLGVNPSEANSDRGYRQGMASGFAQDFLRVNGHSTVNAGLRYGFYSNPTAAFGRVSAFPNPPTDSTPTVGKIFARTRRALLSPQVGLERLRRRQNGGTKRLEHLSRPDSRHPVRSRPATAASFGIEEFVFPQFLIPQHAAAIQPLDVYVTTYHPQFPSGPISEFQATPRVHWPWG